MANIGKNRDNDQGGNRIGIRRKNALVQGLFLPPTVKLTS